eukprot:TRINITY_DN6335_c0_g1_i1.p1 TRINITY_DN6335_c0_g1~~TRINITY_DN6335_c0_g1_i1.p1  ORF type:complete len:141 (+),score=31.57 TRINITY_DN6335_c0_g1_i1:54-476(+)
MQAITNSRRLLVKGIVAGQVRWKQTGSAWDELLKERDKMRVKVDDAIEDQKTVRDDLYEEANRELERDLKRFKGTREEQIAQLQAERERGDAVTRVKEWLYFQFYHFKSILPLYFMCLAAAFFLYSITFMRSMDRSIANY